MTSDPVLIDFGGLSYYTCGVPLKPLSIEECAENEDFQTLERDIDILIKFDQKHAAILFQKWRARAKVKRLNHYQEIFNQWHRMYTYRIQKKQHEANLLRNCVREWHLFICEKKTQKVSSKVVMKKCFATWKKQHQIFALTTRINKASSKIKKTIFFKKWKSRLARKREMKKKQAVVNLFKTKALQENFSIWYEKYLAKTRILSTDLHKKKQFFHKWNANFELSQKLSTSEVAVRLEHNRLTQTRFFLVWRRKARISIKKRSRKMVGNWSKFTKNIIKYYQVKQISALYAEKRVFGKMKEHLISIQNVFLQQYIEKWKRFVDLQKKKKQAIASSQSFTLYRALGRWYITWRAVEDLRLTNTVRETVVNPHLKERFFHEWIRKAQESVDTKRNMAILQRKKSLELKIFKAWHCHVEMLNIRAEEHYNRTLITGAFAIFELGTIGNSRENEIKAEKFREMKLKKKYFKKFRSFKAFKPVVPEAPVDNSALAQIISMLNTDVGMIKASLL